MSSKRKERLLARHKEVRDDFTRLRDSKKFKHTYILEMLAKKHHYSERSIELIIAKDDTDPIYANTNQLNLFGNE